MNFIVKIKSIIIGLLNSNKWQLYKYNIKYRIFKNLIERYDMNIIVLILGIIIGSF